MKKAIHKITRAYLSIRPIKIEEVDSLTSYESKGWAQGIKLHGCTEENIADIFVVEETNYYVLGSQLEMI